MREIKFRGKRIDKHEWVYGLLIECEYGSAITGKKSLYHIDGAEWNFDMVIIEPETIGQFTGLHDKNGKEIYEGDLISEDGSKPYEVVWQYHSVQWIMQYTGEGKTYRHMAYDYAQQQYEVIGNIYENPELL
jgi:uncharacterized phage protein (TIGR01671 family)